MCDLITCPAPLTTLLLLQISNRITRQMNPFIAHLVADRRLQTAGLILATLIWQAPAFEQIYKWTDDRGEVHYSQTPPPGDIATQKIRDPRPPADSPQIISQEQQKLQQQLDAMDERRLVQEEQEALTKERKELATINDQNCITARNNLANLQQGGIKRYQTPEGDVVRLTDEERQRRLAEAHKQVENFCKP